jgi:hypothetical protein
LPNQDVTCIEDSKVCIEYLKNNTYDYLFLDHDLGGQQYVKSGENTGYEVAKFLEENPHLQPKNIILHSFNEVGRKNMKLALPNAFEAPGCWFVLKLE